MTFMRRPVTKLCFSTFLLAAAVPVAMAQTTPYTKAQILAALDPDMSTVVQVYDSVKGTPTEQLTPQDARQQVPIQDAAKIISRLGGRALAPTPVGKVTDGLTIPGPSGNAIPIRIYTPAGTGPFPVVVYFHGGGFVVATIDTYDESARALCADANAIVVSVEYRKAPEAPFPAAYNDAITSYRWVTQNIATYNGIPQRTAVAGESAGGNLAIEVSLAGVAGQVQMPTHELLIYPETSGNLNQTSDVLLTDNSLPLYTAELLYFGNLYLNGASTSNPQVAPINATLTGLPPTTIIAAQVDPLLSDGIAFTTALKAANVPVTYQFYTGVTHEFFGMGAVVAKAKSAEMFGAAQLDASFNATPIT